MSLLTQTISASILDGSIHTKNWTKESTPQLQDSDTLQLDDSESDVTENEPVDTENNKKSEILIALELKQREMEEEKNYVDSMVNEKAKEMTKLYASIEQFEDGQDDRRKKMSRIDLAIKNLEDEKATLVKEYDSAAE